MFRPATARTDAPTADGLESFAMQGIFISYRRQDAAGYAGRLYDRLVSHFGAERVFMDVEGIEPGVDFVEALEQAVASCEVLIVIIGAEWLATDSARKRRLDDPKDFVHIETAAALARHIRVVPVLVDGAVMPREEELPADLAPLARRQAVELSHKHWDATSAELIRTLERVLDGDKAPFRRKAGVAPTPLPATGEAVSLGLDTRKVRPLWVIGGTLALVAAAVGIYLTQPWQEPEQPVPQAERTAVAPPADTVAPRTAEKAAPPPEGPPARPEEKAAPVAPDKPPAPSAEKAAPQPPEKPATPSIAKTEAPVPAPESKKASEAASAPAPAPKKASETASAPAPAPKKASEIASAPAPPEKVAGATSAPPVQTPSAPVATPATTLPVTPPVASTAALPATLPRVGDTWEYRMRSKWQTVKPRTYAHRVTAVSAREVAETMSVDASPDGATVRNAFTSDTRFVEWRGQGFYLLEFNPFLEVLGGLQDSAATLNLPAMPAENPYHAGWYGRARVRGYESVTVPAGTFKSLKVEIDSSRHPTESPGMRAREPVRTLLTLWYSPEVKRTVKMLRIVLTEEGMQLDEDTYELVRYRVQ